MYRLRYWRQDTVESGSWHLSGLMSKKNAIKLIDSNVYENANLIPDEGYSVCKNCAHRNGEECEQHGGREIYFEDTCENWTDIPEHFYQDDN